MMTNTLVQWRRNYLTRTNFEQFYIYLQFQVSMTAINESAEGQLETWLIEMAYLV